VTSLASVVALALGVAFLFLTLSVGARWIRAVWRRRDAP
jgi:hypothetical protein